MGDKTHQNQELWIWLIFSCRWTLHVQCIIGVSVQMPRYPVQIIIYTINYKTLPSPSIGRAWTHSVSSSSGTRAASDRCFGERLQRNRLWIQVKSIQRMGETSRARWRNDQLVQKHVRWNQHQLSVIQLALCVSVSLIWCCLSVIMPKSQYKAKHEGESKSQYKQCVPPCKRYLCAGDTLGLCVVCLEARHAEVALEGADCPHCESLPLRIFHSRKALFSSEGSFVSVPRGAGSASAEAERQRRSWGSQRDLVEGSETSESSPVTSHDRSPRSEARHADTSPRA